MSERLEKLRIGLRAAEQAESLMAQEFGFWLRSVCRDDVAMTSEQCVERGAIGLAYQEGRRSILAEIEKQIGRLRTLSEMHDEEVNRLTKEEFGGRE